MSEDTGKPEAGPTDSDRLVSFATERIALLLCVQLQICAERYPEELRAALATAFDIRGYEELARKAKRECESATLAAQEAKGLMQQIRKSIEGLEADLDRLRFKDDSGNGHHRRR